MAADGNRLLQVNTTATIRSAKSDAVQTEVKPVAWLMTETNDRKKYNLFSYRVRFFGRICDPRSYGFFDTKETQNPKKDYFVMTRQAGGTQYLCQNDISLVLP